MNKSILRYAAVAAIVVVPVLGHAQDSARVVSSTPVLQKIATQQQVCSDVPVTTQGEKSGAGAVIGGVAGGAVGNSMGHGSGRAAATALGIIGGAVLGNKIEGGGTPQVQTQRQCSLQTVYQDRVVGYNVVYEFAGRQYSAQMPQDPGPYVGVQVLPVSPAMQQPAPPIYMAPR